MVTDKERYLFDLNGFIVVPGVLEPREVQHINAVIDKYGLIERRQTIGFMECDQRSVT